MKPHNLRPGLFCLFMMTTLECGFSTFAQEMVTVKAGTRIIDYFPSTKRFLYPEFTQGTVMFRDGTFTAARLNYNILYGEIQFIHNRDTLSIYDEKNIRYVGIRKDTFYYDKGYLRAVEGNRIVLLAVREFIKIIDSQKQGAYGTTSSTSAVTSYNSVSSGGKSFNLLVNEDLLLKKEADYFLYTPKTGFQIFRRKTVMDAFPGQEDILKKYLKAEPVNFDKQEDLIRLVRFLEGLQ